jgi:diguanylate cyclase (GGDEF)-like protein/PAS domain S-box-containing protein
MLGAFTPPAAILLTMLWRAPVRPLSLALIAVAAAVGWLFLPGQEGLFTNALIQISGVVICAMLLRRFCACADPIDTLPGLTRFILCAGLIGPAVTATILSLNSTPIAVPHWPSAWLLGFSTQAQSLLTLSPLVLILCRDRTSGADWPDSTSGWAQMALVLSLVVVTVLLSQQVDTPDIVFLLMPSVMLATLRFGQIGTAAAMVLSIVMLDVAGLASASSVPPYLAILSMTALVAATQLRQHRQLVLELSGSEARYRILAEGSSDVVMLIDGGGLCQHISQSVRNLIDCPPGAILGRSACSYIHPEDVEKVRQAGLWVLSKPRQSATVTHRVRHRSGEWIWCETRLRAQDDVPGGFVCAIRDVSEQHAREELLEYRASIDSLTGLLNRDSLKRSLETAMRAALADQQSLALVIFDVDHFKRVNDAHGHPVGDRVLQMIGDACGQVVRMTDYAGRVGGEEFALVLPGATIAAATDVCMRLRETIAESRVTGDDRRPIEVTISAGISTCRTGMTQSDLISAADRALYTSKHDGRDRVFAAIGDQFIRAL